MSGAFHIKREAGLRLRSPAAVILLAGALLCTLGASRVAAQDQPDPYARCAALGGDAQRLACFDQTYAHSAEIQAEQQRQQEETRETEFGLSARERDEAGESVPGQSADDRARNAPEPGLMAQIAAVSEDGRRALVQLDNGQVWRETDGSTMRNRVRTGWTATITRHWSGAYEMRFAERSGYLRVARVR